LAEIEGIFNRKIGIVLIYRSSTIRTENIKDG